MPLHIHTDFPDWSRSWAERKLAQHHDRGLAMPDETILRNVRDWLFSLPGTKMHDKLDRISWPQAVEAQAKWHKALARRAERTKAFGGRPDDVDRVMTLEDGYRWVRITSPEGLDYEGNAMGHCVGRGAYDEAVIYSLRGPDNLPHCTVEYIRETNTVSQVQGKANKPVIDRYHGMVGAFIDHLKPTKVGNSRAFGHIFAVIAGQHQRLWPVAEFLPWLQAQDKVEIEGALDLTGCASLTHLPDSLDVKRLDLTGCTGLTHLPDGMEAVWIDLSGCTGLTHLPDGLNVSDVLDLDDCTGLTHLPDGLELNELNLTGCTGLTHLPDGLELNELNLTGCTGLTHLPDRLEADWLNLSGCTGLTHLPDRLEADWLNLSGCTGLTHLPDGLNVSDVLDLTGCTSLTHLPDSLKVDALDLGGCTMLTHLPNGLKVKRLHLDGCTGLTHLPESLKVDRLLLPDGTSTDLDGAQAWFEDKFPQRVARSLISNPG